MRKVARNSLMTVAAAGSVLAATAGYASAAGSGAHGGAVGSPGVASGNSVQVPVHIPVNVCGNTIDVLGLLNSAVGNTCVNGSGGKHAAGPQHGTGGKHAKGKHAKSTPGDATRGGGHGNQAGGAQHGGAQAGGGQGGGAVADGHAHGSPGVLSGNQVQVPVHIPLNVCGNTIDIIGVGNSALGNDCENDAGEPVRQRPVQPPKHAKPKPQQPERHQPKPAAPHEQAPAPEKISHVARTQPVSDPQVHADEPQLAQTGAGALDLLAPASAGLLLAGAVLYRRSRVRGH
ncbi:DUF320 domain-containing protein [Streptomyces pactum]|uniref:DUF320 domain-containing protein n=1 Tax=Streptomyces pactum TaxID=68249 RepID=A0ABS0NG41_9ACTN|nr:chaplin family protein [Streptomyces pactum]MBH5334084.1 DUF320 domain-containing protein [Streptomyces pactum]